MKKVVFTLALAFFAMGLFAQTAPKPAAKPAAAPTTTAQKDPAKTMPVHTTSAKPQAGTSKPAAKPAETKPAAPASNTKQAAGTTPKKKHYRHHKKAAAPATGSEKSAPAPKKN